MKCSPIAPFYGRNQQVFLFHTTNSLYLIGVMKNYFDFCFVAWQSWNMKDSWKLGERSFLGLSHRVYFWDMILYVCRWYTIRSKLIRLVYISKLFETFFFHQQIHLWFPEDWQELKCKFHQQVILQRGRDRESPPGFGKLNHWFLPFWKKLC